VSRLNALFNKFNRGEVSPLAFARTDFDVIDTAELMENWVPMRLGPMTYRPGLEYLNTVPGETYLVPFVFGIDDKAILEFTDELLRVWVDDTPVTRVSVTSSILNGTFDSDLTSWTAADEGGDAVSAWENGTMKLTGDGEAAAIRYQLMTNETAAQNALRFTILDASVELTLGYAFDQPDIYNGLLSPGIHSLAFTPTSSVYITLKNREKFAARVDSVAVESSGVMTIPHDIPEASLSLIRPVQSADVVFVACEGYEPFVIERRADNSWSVAEYLSYDGPYDLINTTKTTLAPAALSGDTTITASSPLFTSDRNLNSLIRLDSVGQTVTQTLSGESQQTEAIRVSGIDNGRKFAIEITGTWVATITLQRSAGGVGAWVDVEDYTSNQSKNYDDGFDNAIMYYRLAIKAGDYTSGSAVSTLTYSAGSITGYAKVTLVSSSTSVNVKVYKDFGGTDASLNWYFGSWSESTGFPSAADMFEGRLWYAGKNKVWGSVSDNYYSYDSTIEGASRSITRTIGFGAVDVINWIFAATRMCLGTAGTEVAVRSTSFNEPLTSTTANLKRVDTQGSAKKDIAEIGRHGFYVQHAGTRVLELITDSDQAEYAFYDLMTAHPEIGNAGIKRVVAQHQPELRVHAILDDGTVIVNLQERAEELRSWYRLTFDGLVEDACVIKGATIEDDVYYVINRSGVRTLEKFSQIAECRGGTTSCHFDSFATYTSPGASVSTHIADGTTVGIWADGQDRGTATVAASAVTLPASTYTSVVVGIPYVADYKSPKLGFAGSQGTTIGMMKRVVHVGIIGKWMAPDALSYGKDFTTMYNLPDIEDGTAVDQTVTQTNYDEPTIPFDGEWDTDARVCLRATGPTTLLASIYTIELTEKT